MELFASPRQYLYNLQTTSSSEAKRMWRRSIKEKWNHQCAYCGSSENLTLDHVIPQSKGGPDETKNVVCCCQTCNHDKGHTSWETWYNSQYFFDPEKYQKILEWMEPEKPKNLYAYGSRRNNAT